MNLLSVIEEIGNKIIKLQKDKQLEITKITERYDRQIEEYKTALEVNKKLNTTCRYCDGKGYTEEPSDSTYDCRGYDRISCGYCNGTGRKSD